MVWDQTQFFVSYYIQPQPAGAKAIIMLLVSVMIISFSVLSEEGPGAPSWWLSFAILQRSKFYPPNDNAFGGNKQVLLFKSRDPIEPVLIQSFFGSRLELAYSGSSQIDISNCRARNLTVEEKKNFSYFNHS